MQTPVTDPSARTSGNPMQILTPGRNRGLEFFASGLQILAKHNLRLRLSRDESETVSDPDILPEPGNRLQIG
jgi:hypothetical protein